ncbi:ATP-binding cassette domain-containing protein [Micromonospora sp. NPDC048830]|uniref:ATP-binding cassette domain-containing protein n=1 Tax=Micromonospora sp. NPDC048830 TaxID=3364257 RepID=UPI00371F7255
MSIRSRRWPENLAIALDAARGQAGVETPGFIKEVFPKLAALSCRLSGSLSGGEQQMLAVARALMAEPSLITFDEPWLGLAPVVVNDLYASNEAIRARGVSALLIEQRWSVPRSRAPAASSSSSRAGSSARARRTTS